MFDLLDPALRDVLHAVRTRDGEAEEQHVRVGVREGPQPDIITSITQLSSASPNLSHKPIQPVVILLASRVPEGELHRHVVHVDAGHVSLEHCGHVLGGVVISAEHVQEAGLIRIM